MLQHHPYRARYFSLFTRTAFSLRALTSITLAFSFFITPLAPVLAQTASDTLGQPATDTATTDQSTPQASSPDTTNPVDTTDQPTGKDKKDATAADSSADQQTQKNDNSKKRLQDRKAVSVEKYDASGNLYDLTVNKRTPTPRPLKLARATDLTYDLRHLDVRL